MFECDTLYCRKLVVKGGTFVYQINAYLNESTGEKQTELVKLEQKQKGNVIAVFIKGFIKGFSKTLDADFGAGIEISLPNVSSWMANFRYCEYWCKPQFGKALDEIPDETQGLIYQKEDGTFGVILPVVSNQYKCVLCGKEDTVLAKLFSWYEGINRIDTLAFVYAEGDNPYKLLENCAGRAAELLNNGLRTVEKRRYPKIFEYLGWCSWDAFEIRVTEQDLENKCKEFKAKNIPIKWAIIDDMWGEVRDFYDMEYSKREEMFELMHAAKLYSFQADPYRFPNGLKHCISKIKDYGITVGMWHPTTGYWRGIDPEGDIYREMKDCLIETPEGKYVHSYKQDKAYMYYNAIHDYLAECGAEFVKIDNQSMTRTCYKGYTTVGEASRSYHKAMEASVGQHFDNCMINCMGMASEDMWNRSVSPISRCSDDFQPENRAWFAKHITQCAFNGLIQGQFYYCDWDMWWTNDEQALKNSVLRAVSGGPIYVSDTLDRSCGEVLKPLAFDDGKILRCDKPAVPTMDCLMQDPSTQGKIFKVQNTCGSSAVIAAFHLDESAQPAIGSISPSDVNGIEGEEFAVYEHFTQELKILKKNEAFDLQLNNADDFRLYVIVPIIDNFAPIGRIDKFISPKSIKSVKDKEIELVEDGDYAYVIDGKLVIVEK